MARLWRAYHVEMPQASGETVRLSEAESHHVRRVLRLSPGDPLSIFDGRGAEWLASIVAVDSRGVAVRTERPLDDVVESPLDVCVYQGLCRPEKMDGVVQKLTEVGVAAIHPLGCRYAERFPPDEKRLARWRRIAMEACKQSGRRRLPEVEPAPGLPPAGDVTSWVLHPGAGSRPLAEELGSGVPGRCRLAAGPEQGFTEQEVDLAVDAGWRPVSLGPRILRAETAGLVAASLVLHAWSDLGR